MIQRLPFLFVLLFMCCNNGKKIVPGKTSFQRNRNISFQDVSSSPLKAKDLKSFTGLNFYELDSTYILNGELQLFPKPITEFLLTSSGDKRRVNKMGHIVVKIKNQSFTLLIYEGEPGKEEYFLPFGDLTNGTETYGAGRYLDLPYSKDNNIIKVDFNKSYNPYCAYNEKFSCPLVPLNNILDIEVEAGEKNFK